jgi:hypothetical protein
MTSSLGTAPFNTTAQEDALPGAHPPSASFKLCLFWCYCAACLLQAACDASTCFGAAFELLPEPISIFTCFGLAASFFCSVTERTPFS